MLSPMASSTEHFPQILHFTMLMLQLLKGINNTKKFIDTQHQTFYIKKCFTHTRTRTHARTHTHTHRLSQEECARLREGVPYVKVFRYNPKHLCPKLNGFGDNGQRKVWSSLWFHALYLSADRLMHAHPSVWCHITAVQLTLSLNCLCTSFRVIM
jgi:hypothetical protein